MLQEAPIGKVGQFITKSARDILDESLESERGSLGIVGIHCGSTGLVNKIAFDLRPLQMSILLELHFISFPCLPVSLYGRAMCTVSLPAARRGRRDSALSLSFSPLAVSYRPGPERAARALNPLYVSRAPSSPRPAPRASVASVAAAAALRSSHLARLADCLKEIKSESGRGRARRAWSRRLL